MGKRMPRGSISYETANKLASVWPSASNLREAFEKIGIKSDIRNLYKYRRQAEEMLGIRLPTLTKGNYQPRTAERYDLDHEYTIAIFSDAHFWPFETTDAFYIFLEIIQEIQPEVVLNNGDSLDGATISRHPANGWENPPSLVDELDANREHLELVKEAAGEADLYWCEGNHDKRFEMFLAKQAPQFRDMPGTTLKGLFPDWKICDSVFFNDLLQVKHRWHNGVHAAYNNTLKSGKSMATGHTHRLTCREYTDLNGTRYGIECGTLADIYGPQFSYTENNPVQWQQGFPVLTIDKNGLHVELVQVINGKARFRGKVYG
jgi:hypothetical protein